MRRWLIRYRLRANDRRLKIVLAERNTLATIINTAEAVSYRLLDRLIAYDGELARLRDLVDQGRLDLMELDSRHKTTLRKSFDKEMAR